MTKKVIIEIFQTNSGKLAANINGDMSVQNILMAFAQLQIKLIRGDYTKNSNMVKTDGVRNISEELDRN